MHLQGCLLPHPFPFIVLCDPTKREYGEPYPYQPRDWAGILLLTRKGEKSASPLATLEELPCVSPVDSPTDLRFAIAIKSVLGIDDPPIHSYFPEIEAPRRPKALSTKEIFAVGLGRLVLSYLYHNKSLNDVGFGSVSAPLACH